MEGLERIVKENPFFGGMQDPFCALVCACAKNIRFAAGQHLLHEEAVDTPHQRACHFPQARGP